MGLAGFAGLTLPGILRLQAQSPRSISDKSSEKTAVIMVWKPGGCSHIDTYDPKPQAESEYRGPFGTIPTKKNALWMNCFHAGSDAAATVLRSMRQELAVTRLVPADAIRDPDTRQTQTAPRTDVGYQPLPEFGPRSNHCQGQHQSTAEYNGPAYLETPIPFTLMVTQILQTSLYPH
jgi:hypothetical protein